ncbi:MAG: [FeFe] hydrogenase H-cluster radical SAM maturase HydE [Candidatus Kapaibacterium sp.]
MSTLTEILSGEITTASELVYLLSLADPGDIELLREKAYEVMAENVGEKVYLRGLVEYSNICACDCLYCGIRRSNRKVKRYVLDKNEIIDAAKWAAEQGFGSIVIQGGERSDARAVEFVADVVCDIKKVTKSDELPEGLGITLSIGELEKSQYEELYSAGAHRYLLRIETTNRELFHKIHPWGQDFDKRLKCLELLRETGYQVGTGIMIGLPWQGYEDLANDLMFFRDFNIDMIGMGPYLPHEDTPLSIFKEAWNDQRDRIYRDSLKMIAVTRIFLKDVNMASTTALQTIDKDGRKNGLLYGANIIMPQMTPIRVRGDYLLYNNKPCLDHEAVENKKAIEKEILSAGRQPGYNQWGDSRHFKLRAGHNAL